MRALGVLALLGILIAVGARAAELAADRSAADARATITDPVKIWELPTAQKSLAHPLRIEGRISYVDARWRHLWIENNGAGVYIMLSPRCPPLHTGQRVRIEGTITPTIGLDAATVTVTSLLDHEPIEPLSLAGRIGDLTLLNSRIVSAEGYVDAQQLIDDDHVRLALIIDDQPVIAYVKPQDPKSVPDWQGRFVRITGLYQGRFDPTRTQLTVELWTGRESDVLILSSIADSQLFSQPLCAINALSQAGQGQQVRIRGMVVAAEPGLFLVVRDETGQTTVRSGQQQRLTQGTEVDAVGRVEFSNARWTLQSALFRVVRPLSGDEPPPDEGPGALTRVEQIRRLSVEEAALGRPVDISGVVTWALPGLDFFFLQDLTGGLRVHYRPEQMPAPQRNKYLQIRGVTYNGGFAPAVELQDYTDLGAMSSPPVREVTFDRAITGEEDGQLVDMRGFYRKTESDGDLRRVYVTTPTGEFVGLLKSPVTFEPTPGSLVRVHGPCEVIADDNGRVSGILVRVPSLAGLIIEEDAPVDPYALPLRTIKHLHQLSTARDLTRVRISGVVLHAVPGRHVYVQQDASGLLLLSRETLAVAPGDQIEAVGILGREGVRTILREAVYRKLHDGPPPQPVPLREPSRLLLALDSRLVTVRGVLIDAIRRPEQTRLTLQAGNTLFEATLDGPGAAGPPLPLTVGAGLELTGIYRIGFDDSRQSRSFHLQLRSTDDVVVYQRAQVWTVPRALIATAGFGGCTLLVLAWVAALRRRVQRQTTQIRAQLERQAQLEAEVQRATRLESLGVLAGGIAHDFNNLLTIVMGNLSLAMLDEKVMAAVGDILRDSERGAMRARDLTQQLLTFAKGGSPLRSTVSLPEIVQETTAFLLHGSRVRCDYDLSSNLWNASVDKDQIAQVIQNLVLNAMQAMPEGGVIRISLRNETIAAGHERALAPGRYLRLAIADSGTGIEAKILPRIFDPYFSTKRTGTGLGLATVYSIVRKHQGDIEAKSTPGEGSTFTLWLPAAEASACAATPARMPEAAAPLTPGRTARVLLMDDEEPIRRLGAALLRRLDLEPTLVRDGAEALREFADARAAGRPFDLVILDLTIPGGMGGRETIDRIRALDSDVAAIVSSGYSNDPVLADLKRHGFQAMVVKPYEASQLMSTIQQLLAERRR